MHARDGAIAARGLKYRLKHGKSSDATRLLAGLRDPQHPRNAVAVPVPARCDDGVMDRPCPEIGQSHRNPRVRCHLSHTRARLTGWGEAERQETARNGRAVPDRMWGRDAAGFAEHYGSSPASQPAAVGRTRRNQLAWDLARLPSSQAARIAKREDLGNAGALQE